MNNETGLMYDVAALTAEVESLRTQLTAAEERADRAEKRSQFNKDNHLMAEKEIDRLTAQVKEWYDKWVQATNDLACESEELDTLRRSSVRVDVLLRWIQSRSRVLSILGGSIMSRAGSNPGEQAKALLSWLTSVLSKRQARTTNTKGGRR